MSTRQGIAMGVMAVLAALVIGAVVGYQQWLTDTPDDGPEGGPLVLSSTRGEFALSRLEEGQVAVLFFGYTHCPDVCPMTLAVVRQALAELAPAQRERVVPVMISLDPDRDSLARLEEYVGHFGEAFIGATGSEARLAAIAERYGVVWRRVETPDSAMGYTLDHSSSLYLVDREGSILQRVLYSPVHQSLLSALERVLET